ncbi:MAG: phosphopentomutase [Nitrospirae bacterium RIFCSPLOWO2_01_FULL_62_17]|nr:MAG: phosphopentomutase [Nitrospirae bacterium RIFCSPLOWO2_01_FULL_62_17]
MVNRVILIVLDGVGVGAQPDANAYGDEGAHTLAHVAEAVGGLRVPNLEALGLGHLGPLAGVRRTAQPDGCFGRMAELSKGKDSTTGHWEMTGVVLEKPFPTFPNGFPPEIIESFQQAIGRKTLGNYAASGTAIIQEMGIQHLQTGSPIIYTSADSAFQIAAHEQVIPAEELYGMCRTARKLLSPPHQVARVIARPFTGEPGAFVRTDGRRDFSVEPTAPTLLDSLKAEGYPVIGIGKIDDLFKGRGLTRAVPTKSDTATVEETLRALKSVPRGLIFSNLIEFDMLYGHRNDAAGFARAVQAFDARLPDIIGGMQQDDLLCITADHGNDPTRSGTDHTREYVPLLVYGARAARGVNLGTRKSFADLGQTIAESLAIKRLARGESFLHVVMQG